MSDADEHDGWWRHLVWAIVILLILIGVGNIIYSVAGLQDRQDRKEAQDLSDRVAACRSVIASDDAVAVGNKAITSQRVFEVGIAAVLARDPSATPEQRAAFAAAAARFTEVFLADIAASQVRYEMALRRTQANDLCASGEIPEAQVQPLPVAPVIVLPEAPGVGGPDATSPPTTTAPGVQPSGNSSSNDDEPETASPPIRTTTPPPGATTSTTRPPVAPPVTTAPGTSAPGTTRPPTTAAPTTTTSTVTPQPGLVTAVVTDAVDIVQDLLGGLLR